MLILKILNLELYSSKYDNFILMGDYNCEVTSAKMKSFCEDLDLKSLINVPTCFKALDNPSCIDLILTNFQKRFPFSTTIETGLSDFHKLVLTVLNDNFKKLSPRISTYRDYKKFPREVFQDELNFLLSHGNKSISSFETDIQNVINLLDTHAP